MDKEFFIKNKKKIIIVVAAIAVSLIGFSLLNSTYSLFYHKKLLRILKEFYWYFIYNC